MHSVLAGLLSALWRGLLSLRKATLAFSFWILTGTIAFAANISVSFPAGIVGIWDATVYSGQGASPQKPVQIKTFDELTTHGGVDTVMLSQTSSGPLFEQTNDQGNDVPFYITYIYKDGSYSQPQEVVLNWSDTSHNNVFGFFTETINEDLSGYYAEGTLAATVSGISYGLIPPNVTIGDGNSFDVDISGDELSGSAANPLTYLNNYYTSTLALRPQGPVTVAEPKNVCNEDSSVDLTGGVTLRDGETLKLAFNGSIYWYDPNSETNDISVVNGQWSITISPMLADGTYDVVATIYTAEGYSLSDPTSNEVHIGAEHCGIPSLTISKQTEQTSLAAPQVDDVIDYTIELVNTGSTAFTSVVLTDALTNGETALSGPDSGDDVNPGVFDVGETWVFTTSHSVTQADIDAGKVENTAFVSATTADLTEATAWSSTNNVASTATAEPDAGYGVITLLTQNPSLALVKTAVLNDDDGTEGVSAGDTIDYSFTVTNTGNVTVTGITVSDPLVEVQGGPIDLGPAEVDSTTFTATYTVTQDDIDAGKVTNQALAEGSDPNEDPVSDDSDDGEEGSSGDDPTETPLDQSPAIKITKVVDDSALDDGVRPGDVLSYTITIENIGNTSLKGVNLQDVMTDLAEPMANELTLTDGPTWDEVISTAAGVSAFAPGETIVYTASFELTDEVIATGGVENLAIVDAYVDTNGNDSKDLSEPEVTAESKVGGNTSASPDGTPTPTGFPGEISGQVLNYTAPMPGVDVCLFVWDDEAQDYVPVKEGEEPLCTATDEDGNYVFVGLPSGDYAVKFDDPNSENDPKAASGNNANVGNMIKGIDIGAGKVEAEQDAFFVDPSGIVYDSYTLAPIVGATVTLMYNGDPVQHGWLNTLLGNENGTQTDVNGNYSYFLDPVTAPDGIYTLVVTKAGYEVSTVYPAVTGPLDMTSGAHLGGGLEAIVDDDVPGASTPKTYYMSFNFVFTANPATSSNGIVNNHIPMDAALLPKIEDDLVQVLTDDLAATMKQQSALMNGFAASALERLKSRDGNACLADLIEVLNQNQIQFDTDKAILKPESNAVLDQLAEILGSCDGEGFEIAGHTDSDASDAYNLRLSQARVDAVVAALGERGVDTSRLRGTGFGESRPIADNATAEGKALNRRVEFLPLDLAAADEGCVETTTRTHALDLHANQDGTNAEGSFESETKLCGEDALRIVSGEASLMTTDSGMAQYMLTLSARREAFVGDDAVRGRFAGFYLSQNAVTGLAEGEIRGFGVYAGLYGANRMAEQLYIDYYLGASAGQHSFSLDFDRGVDGVITGEGAYRYAALFAGAALSGEVEAGRLTFSPRAGADLAWSPGGVVDANAIRDVQTQTGTLSIGQVTGARAFGELRIENLLNSDKANLAIVPRGFCDQAIGSTAAACGWGYSVELTSSENADAVIYSLRLDDDRSASHHRTALSLSYETVLWIGTLSGEVNVDEAGRFSLGQMFKMDF